MNRPQVDIPTQPQPPFPLTASSHIVSGFGRGSLDLGIPTANIPMESLSQQFHDLPVGVYFGFCRVSPNLTYKAIEVKLLATPDSQQQRAVEFSYGHKLSEKELITVFPHVMSIGWNPFYQNKEKAAEVHIMHKFDRNFYGAAIEFNVLGYIRPELDYTTKEALIADIQEDIAIALRTLDSDGYKKYSEL